MTDFRASVVITTYNRAGLLPRAIASALDQQWKDTEVLVIDDGSSDSTPEVMRGFPQLRYVRQANLGVCAARNRGIREASQPWIIFLDDDDRLLPGAIARIASCVAELPDASRYPLCQFPRSNGRVAAPFLIARMDEFLNGSLQGDFAPVIRRDKFLAEGLSYPEERTGAEFLLWWKIADKYGIPTWADPVQALSTDAPFRMMSTRFHLEFARETAELHERALSEFGVVLRARFPARYRKEQLLAAIYRVLADEGPAARSHLRALLRDRVSAGPLAVWLLSYLPSGWARGIFSSYRRHVTGWET
jgi:glycosyltransferase involved in cell wall biosynthesis